MLLLSTGLTCGTFCSNEARLTSGSRITVPETSAGSSVAISFSTAMIDAYSVPCEPETSASTGPGFAPLTTTTGMLAAASTPAGTSRKPVAFWPGAADAVPTVKVFGCAWAWAGGTALLARIASDRKVIRQTPMWTRVSIAFSGWQISAQYTSVRWGPGEDVTSAAEAAFLQQWGGVAKATPFQNSGLVWPCVARTNYQS